MFDWLKKRVQRLEPVAQWVVTIESKGIRVSDYNRQEKFVAKDKLSGVAIQTNDTGPWGADVWWLLFGADDQLACAFPQGATGEQAALDYLMALDRFNHDEMISAMGSTQNAVFPVWRKQP